MNELHRIRMELKAVRARMHAADAQASESWHRLRTRHGWALLATLGATAGVAAWWQLRHKAPAHGQDPAVDAPAATTGPQRRPDRAAWRSLLLGLLPGLLPRIAMQVVPLPWRHVVSHPWVRVALASVLSRVAGANKKGAR